MAGYSGTPLTRKLGLKPNARFGAWGAPEGFVPSSSACSCQPRRHPRRRFARQFSSRCDRLFRELAGRAHASLAARSEAAGDVSENELRNLGLASGLVDNKVCAIDEIWSGLRFVIRVRDRRK